MHRWSLWWAVSAYTHHCASLKWTMHLYCSFVLLSFLFCSVMCRAVGGSHHHWTELRPLLCWMFVFCHIPYPSYLYRTITSPGYGYCTVEWKNGRNPQHILQATTQHIHKRTYTPIHRLFLRRHFPRLCFTPIPMCSSCPVSDSTSYLKLSIQTRFFFPVFENELKTE